MSRAHLNLSKLWPMGPRPESAAYKQRLDKSVIYLIILKFQKQILRKNLITIKNFKLCISNFYI